MKYNRRNGDKSNYSKAFAIGIGLNVTFVAVDDEFITSLQTELEKKFKIKHTTFQVESRAMEKNCQTDCE